MKEGKEKSMEQPLRSDERDSEGLESLRREMQSFFKAISHDFQAPVRRIIGFSQIIIEDHSAGLDDVGKRYLNIIASEATRMNSMVTDLLTWYRISACELHQQEIDLSRMINLIVSEEKGKEKAPEIEATVEDGVVIRGDPELVSMAMMELIDNSVKFAHDGTVRKIEFGRKHTEDGVVLFVKDNGVGFDQVYSDKLFIPFQRLHGKEFPGEGMGLAIAGLIFRRHGGRIWAESMPEKGSTFFFVLG